jgi:hypothetical protein
MNPDDKPPQFHFDTPPPFSYEEFKSRIMPMMLQSFDGSGGEYLRSLQGEQEEFLTCSLYVATVVKLQNPNTTPSEMLYAFSYGFVRYFIDQGMSPEAAREDLSKVPWDTLPGLGDYDRETANAVAMRAFADALAGQPQTPLH